MKEKFEPTQTKILAEEAPLPITISIGRHMPTSSKGAVLSLHPTNAFVNEEMPKRPHQVFWRIDEATPLLAGESVVIEAKEPDGEPVPGDAEHKERLPQLVPAGPYEIDESTPEQQTRAVGSPGLPNKPKGNYGWQYRVTLRFQSTPIDEIDPWTVIQKP